MVENEDIFSVFSHISFLSRIFGLIPIIDPATAKIPHKLIRIFINSWIIILMCFYAYIFVGSVDLKKIDSTREVNWFNNGIYRVKIVLGGTMFVVMVGLTPFRKHDFLMLLSKLKDIDEEFRIMSISVSYNKIKSRINAVLYASLAVAICYEAFEIYMKNSCCLDLVEEMCLSFLLFVHLITELQFVIFVWILTFRFKTLNNWLKFYYTPDSETSKNFYWVSPVGVTSSHLAVVSRIHDELCGLTKKTGKMYAFRILLIVSQCFIIMTMKTYYFFSSLYKFRPSQTIQSSLIAVLFDTTQILGIIFATTAASSESSRTAEIVHRLERSKKNDDRHKQDVTLFSLQILHGRINFSACGLFPLDFSLIQSIIGAVTTYLIIIVQFDISGQSRHTSTVNSTAPPII